MSSVAQATGGSPADRFAAVMRAATGRRLGHEARKLREEGTKVLLLQPGRDDCSLMGLNLMSGTRRIEVMEQARKSIARDLRRLRAKDGLLPRRSADGRGAGRRRPATARRAA
jgi:NTE family protein